MGWDTINQNLSFDPKVSGPNGKIKNQNLFKNIKDGAYFYFAHSYYVCPIDKKSVIGTTDYGIRFVSAAAKNNVFGVQFHPEKSGDVGLQLLKNFVTL